MNNGQYIAVFSCLETYLGRADLKTNSKESVSGQFFRLMRTKHIYLREVVFKFILRRMSVTIVQVGAGLS